MTLQEVLYKVCQKRQFELYEYSKIREHEIINIPDFWDEVGHLTKNYSWSNLFFPEITIKVDLITLIFDSEIIIDDKGGSFTKVTVIENK